ncbi:hypothetical protein HWV62_15425 [Athelia sp. TMB]|nr:hypothetical protein HWV62_15425 [Athelia sp. TMB]
MPGETLGRGTYSVVKRAVHMQTHQSYALKVISKKLIHGKENMVKNEIAVLKKTAGGHASIMGLHDYFEANPTAQLELVSDQQYVEDLKPDNVLFATPTDDSRIIIGDFGLSRLLESSKLSLLTHCGTLAQLCVNAILAGDYKFQPPEVWDRVSDAAKDFISECLVIDPINRPTAAVALRHEWLKLSPDGVVATSSPKPPNIYPYVAKAFGKSLRRLEGEPPLFSINVMDLHATSISALIRGNPDADANELLQKFKQYIDESEKVIPRDTVLVDDLNADDALDTDKRVQVQRIGEVVEQPEINT